MPDKFITATTLPLFWTTTTNWNNSTLPVAGDIVYASGRTITINTNITVSTITNASGPSASAGGTFSPSGGSWTLNTNISAGSATISCLTISATTTAQTLTVSGNTNGGASSLAHGINKISGGTLNIIGNISGGTNATAYGLNNNFTQPVNITGSTYATLGSSIVNNLVSNINILGNIFSYSSVTSSIANSSTGTINLIGNVNHGTNTSSTNGITNSVGGFINITGNVYNLSTSQVTSSYAVYNAGAGIVTISGDVYGGGTSSTAIGVYNLGTTGIVSITGNILTYGYVSVQNGQTGTINIFSPKGILQSGINGQPLIYNAGAGTINIVGNISGSTSSSPSGGYVAANSTTANGVINITGDVISRDFGSSSGIITNLGVCTINILGNVYGGSVANSVAVNHGFAGSNINVTGNTYGGSNSVLTPAIYSNLASGTIKIVGNCVAGTAYPALASLGSLTNNIINGSLVYTNGISPYYVNYKLQVFPSGTTPIQSIIMNDTNNNNRYFLANSTGNTAPISGNVRSNIIYSGFSGTSQIQYTGSCIVPPYSSVTLNVPMDNGYGTASGMTINNLSAMISSYFQ